MVMLPDVLIFFRPEVILEFESRIKALPATPVPAVAPSSKFISEFETVAPARLFSSEYRLLSHLIR